MAATLFYSYSHKDEELRIELEKHLALLRREGLIEEWHDRKIGAGREWAEAIDQHLLSSRIILLLISADFLASDYCFDIELRAALARHQKGEAFVIPILLRPADWKSAPFAHLQMLPRDGQAVTTWDNRDEAFVEIAKGIRDVALGVYLSPQRVRTWQPPKPVTTDRVLDAAVPKRVSVGRPTELLAQVRRTTSGGLRAFLEVEEEESDARPEDVRSRSFPIEFPLDDAGRPQPLKLRLQVESPEFEPKSQSKNILVPPDGDSDVCRFLLTPLLTGTLTVQLELHREDIYRAARKLRTECEAGDRQVVLLPMTMVTMPLQAAALAAAAVAAGGAVARFPSPPPATPAPPTVSKPAEDEFTRMFGTKPPVSLPTPSEAISTKGGATGAFGQQTPVFSPPVPVEAAPPRRSRSPWLAPLAAAAMLVITTTALFQFTKAPPMKDTSSPPPKAIEVPKQVPPHEGPFPPAGSAHSVAVFLTDAETGRPVNGQVQLAGKDLPKDETGWFFQAVPDRNTAIRLRITARGYQPQTLTLHPGERRQVAMHRPLPPTK